MKKILLVLLTMFTLANADEETVRVVYDLTTENVAKFEKNILKGIAISKAHFEGNLQEFESAVIIHGEAFRFFLKDVENSSFNSNTELLEAYPELSKRVAGMADTYEVEFLMCEASMPKYGLKKEDIVDFVKFVPTSTIGIIQKQNEGYAYFPVKY
ncbi:DsrE family protein [Sulfurimonas sp. SAG-AH-194-C21]|nr:DsrE family protein [Sulfurimonas sp. SAG-AH-194-C21]MDF1883368.1 DsrE family protein [Sulfurimonas sp. SAG-AH-194-C21]